MISLISGKYKGKKLYQFRNTHVRPTQAKIRKSVFQILEPFDGLEILDLYAGVGTLGFEALSRGASRVVFVEKDRQVFNILQKNKTLFENEKLEMHLMDVIQFISQTRKEKFDIIFADPPYNMTNYEHLKKEAFQCLKPDGIFCLETKKQHFSESYIRIKHYGNTQIVFWKTAA